MGKVIVNVYLRIFTAHTLLELGSDYKIGYLKNDINYQGYYPQGRQAVLTS